MAVKKKSAKSIIALPTALDSMVKRGMTSAILAKFFGEEQKEAAAEIKLYVEENEDGFDVPQGKFETEYGGVTYKLNGAANRGKVDKDILLQALADGRVTAETLVQMATFNASEVEKIGLGEAVTKPSEDELAYSISLTPSAAYREEILVNFDATTIEEIEIRSLEREGLTTSDAQSVVEVRALKRERTKKTKTSENVDADIDEILRS